MLVLARKVGQSIVVGDNVVIVVTEVRGDQVRLGITAPRSIAVHRKELLEQLQAEQELAEQEEPQQAVQEVDSEIGVGLHHRSGFVRKAS